MEHRKIYIEEEISLPDSVLLLAGPVPPKRLADWRMHEGLDAFRLPEEQHQAIIEIAGLPEGRIIAAVHDRAIVGYVTFHYPDPLERWSDGGMDDLVELGAIEVAPPYRSLGLGKRMLKLAFRERQLDNLIIYTTEYYWHWDLKNSGLDVWEYRKMMERLMKSVGMIWYATDDPEICSHPANCLMVKIGPEVPLDSIEQFDRVRFRQRYMY